MTGSIRTRGVAVLASDHTFFYQAQGCIKTLRAALTGLPNVALDLVVIDLGLAPDDIAWLDRAGVAHHPPDPRVPRFPGAPEHAYAMTCRPYLPDSFPGYDVYLWIDSDIRILRSEGLLFYLAQALRPDRTIAISHECEPSYRVSWHPPAAETWLSDRWKRLSVVYGRDIAVRQRVIAPYNAGLFAARAGSPIWAAYRARLGQALSAPYDRMREQDAMNVALFDVGGIARGSSAMNWICSMALPWRAPDGTWRHPDHRESPIHVLHLTQSEQPYELDGRPARLVDLYRKLGLPV